MSGWATQEAIEVATVTNNGHLICWICESPTSQPFGAKRKNNGVDNNKQKKTCKGNLSAWT